MGGRLPACPGEVVTYTCTVIQGAVLEWVAAQYNTNTNPNHPQFTPTTPENTALDYSDSSSAVQCSDFDYQATIADVSNVGSGFADMTSTFRFTANARLNGTVVECRVTILTGLEFRCQAALSTLQVRYSRTSLSGHSEKRTHSLERTKL